MTKKKPMHLSDRVDPVLQSRLFFLSLEYITYR